jgi:hypothetical protein
MLMETLMAQLGGGFGLPDLVADRQGSYRVSFDHVHLALTADSNAQMIIIQSTLGELAPGDESTMEELLGANFFGDGPGGAALAVEDGGRITLTRRVLLEHLEYEAFVSLLEGFVNYAEYWQGKLDQPTGEPPPLSNEHGPSMDLMRV